MHHPDPPPALSPARAAASRARPIAITRGDPAAAQQQQRDRPLLAGVGGQHGSQSITIIASFTWRLRAGRLHQAQLREQRDLVVVEVTTDDPPAGVEVPHLAERQRELLAGGGKRSERPVERRSLSAAIPRPRPAEMPVSGTASR